MQTILCGDFIQDVQKEEPEAMNESKMLLSLCVTFVKTMTVIENIAFKTMLVFISRRWKIYIGGWPSRQYNVHTCPGLRLFQLLLN
jgi:hypothetical protein